MSFERRFRRVRGLSARCLAALFACSVYLEGRLSDDTDDLEGTNGRFRCLYDDGNRRHLYWDRSNNPLHRGVARLLTARVIRDGGRFAMRTSLP